MWVIQYLDILSEHYLKSRLLFDIWKCLFSEDVIYMDYKLSWMLYTYTLLNNKYHIWKHRKDLQYFMISSCSPFSLWNISPVSPSLHGGEDDVLPGLSSLPPAVVDNGLVEKEGEAGPGQGEDEKERFVWGVDQIKDGATWRVSQQGPELVLGLESWRQGMDHTESYDGRNSSVDVENTLRSK